MSNQDYSRPLRPIGIAVLIPVACFLLTAGWLSIPRRHGSIDLIAGRDTFRAHCGGCHFATEGFPAHHGPNLYQIGRTAKLRQPDQTAAQYILESILEPDKFIAPSSRPGMPRNVAAKLSPSQIRNVVAFLASRGEFPDYDEILRLDIPDIRDPAAEPLKVGRRQMELAESVMKEKGQCFECHAMHSHPEYKVIAPGLFGVGLIDKEKINVSLVNPHQEVADSYRTVTVSLESGEIVSGRLLCASHDPLLLAVRDDQGRVCIRQIPVAEVEHEDGQPMIKSSALSPMPSGFEQILTAEEREALVTLIRQLN